MDDGGEGKGRTVDLFAAHGYVLQCTVIAATKFTIIAQKIMRKVDSDQLNNNVKLEHTHTHDGAGLTRACVCASVISPLSKASSSFGLLGWTVSKGVPTGQK